MKKNIFLFFASLFIVSCDTSERNIKKTFIRLNSDEISEASKYIWPEDVKNLYTFNQRYLSQNDLISIDVQAIKSIEVKDEKAYEVSWKCNNCDSELFSYFESKNNLLEKNKIVDTVYLKSANGKEYITFDWGLNEKSISNDIKLSSILVEKLNLRSGPGINFNIIGQFNKGDELLIDDQYNNSNWRKGLFFDKTSKLKIGYLSAKLTDRKEISFFTLDWANSLGVLVVSIIAIIVLFVVYPLLFSALFRAGGEGAGTFAIILFIVLLIAVYFTYQIIETAVFELFLFNLPY
jgi:hypothetical protein